jgi:hypothetical protein
MCLGPELAALVASAAIGAGGSMFNAQQQQERQNDASEAASKATLDNLARQKRQGERSAQLFAEAVPTQSRPAQDAALQDATDTRLTAMKANLGPATDTDYAPTSASTPKVVGQAGDRAAAEGRKKVDAEAAALAKLGGWGDAQQGNRIGLGRTGGQIRENNSFVQGIANLLPQEQQVAVDKITGKPLSPVGDIMQAAGQAGTMYFYPQAAPLTFADTLGMKRPKTVRGGGGASTGRSM